MHAKFDEAKSLDADCQPSSLIFFLCSCHWAPVVVHPGLALNLCVSPDELGELSHLVVFCSLCFKIEGKRDGMENDSYIPLHWNAQKSFFAYGSSGHFYLGVALQENSTEMSTTFLSADRGILALVESHELERCVDECFT